MTKRILAIFGRDLKVSLRDFIALYIILCPLLFAVMINAFTPGANDTDVQIAVLASNQDAAWFEDYAKVERFDNMEQLTYRLGKRDHIIAIVSDTEGNYLLRQGNEPEGIVAYAQILLTFFEKGVTMADTEATITDYGRVIPPAKRVFVNAALMFISVIGGMLIALNIVEEKQDNTISAMHVTPVSRWGFIIGKSIIGVTVPIFGAVVMLLLTGFEDVNMLQMVVVIITLAFLAILVGFLQGLVSDDVMQAAGNIKILFLPLLGTVAAVEMLGESWQKFFWWLPFYWVYKGNDLILSKTGNWGSVLMHAGISLALCLIVFALVTPKIRKGLE